MLTLQCTTAVAAVENFAVLAKSSGQVKFAPYYLCLMMNAGARAHKGTLPREGGKPESSSGTCSHPSKDLFWENKRRKSPQPPPRQNITHSADKRARTHAHVPAALPRENPAKGREFIVIHATLLLVRRGRRRMVSAALSEQERVGKDRSPSARGASQATANHTYLNCCWPDPAVLCLVYYS